MSATQIDGESEKNPIEISAHTSEDSKDETPINGKKSTKNTREKAGTTCKLQTLSRHGKKTCPFLNQVSVRKVRISFKKNCQSLATKKSNFNAKTKFARMPQECKAEQQQT